MSFLQNQMYTSIKKQNENILVDTAYEDQLLVYFFYFIR